MSKAGRPPVPDDQRRKSRTLRMTDAEWDRVAEACDLAGFRPDRRSQFLLSLVDKFIESKNPEVRA